MMHRYLMWLFRNEIGKYQEELKAHYGRLEREVKQKASILEKRYNLVQRIFCNEGNVSLVGLEKNKSGEELIVCERFIKNDITIKLYGPSYQGVNGNPRIMAELRKVSDSTNEASDTENASYYIKIVDILMEDNDIGNGSIAMKYLVKMVERLKINCGMRIEYISGMLSWVDKEHFDRSEHYYKKFGFDVEFNGDRSSGKIRKAM